MNNSSIKNFFLKWITPLRKTNLYLNQLKSDTVLPLNIGKKVGAHTKNKNKKEKSLKLR